MTDRPWVKPHHDPRCSCKQCVPRITHHAPRIGPVAGGARFEYPCGKLVATSNALQDADIAAGATHSQCYGYPERVTCPECRY